MLKQSIVKEAIYKDWALNNEIVLRYCEENHLDMQRLKQMKADYLPDRIVFLQPSSIKPRGYLVLEHFARNGQKPYAIIICCSDSRVIPERIFHAAIGDLFTIRVAGNVIDDHQLGSIEYAAGHLGTKLVVLGHTGCGAVHAAIEHDPSGFIKYITDEIRKRLAKKRMTMRPPSSMSATAFA